MYLNKRVRFVPHAFLRYGSVAQSVELLAHNRVVHSSILCRSTIYVPIAQLIEQRPFKALVVGLSPSGDTNLVPTGSRK